MKRKWILIMAMLFALIFVGQVFSQRNYVWEVVPGSFTPLVGGTSILPLTFGNESNGYTANIPLGFDFIFFYNQYHALTIGTNGIVAFPINDNYGHIGYHSNPNYLFSTSVNNVVAPWWNNLNMNTANGGSITYATEGTAPNRVFIVQWENVSSRLVPDPTNIITFQVRLYEGSNVIEFSYGSFGGNPYTGAAVGIEDSVGGSGHFINGLNGSKFDNTKASNFPPFGTGQIIRFTPVINDISVGGFVSLPANFIVGQVATIEVIVSNNGLNDQTGVPVRLFVDGSQIGSDQLIDLAANHDTTLAFNWTPSSTGQKTIMVKTFLSGDQIPANDSATVEVTVFPAGTILYEGFTDYQFDPPPPVGWIEARGYYPHPDPNDPLVNWSGAYFANPFLSSGNRCAEDLIFGTFTRDWFITPVFDLTGAANPILVFRHAGVGASSNQVFQGLLGADDSIAVVVSTDGGTTWGPFAGVWTNGSEPNYLGETSVLDLSAWNTANQVKLGFYVTAGRVDNTPNLQFDYYMDDVLIRNAFTNDVGVGGIWGMPSSIFIEERPFPIIAQLVNFGTASQSNFSVTLEILNESNQIVFATTKTFGSLNTFTSDTLFMVNWNPPAPGNYTLRAYTSLAGDEEPGNDAQTRDVVVQSYASGGPDGGGYFFADNRRVDGPKPDYSWIEASDGVDITTTWDASNNFINIFDTTVALPFDFHFYGVDFPAGSKITISSNGWAAFGIVTNAYQYNHVLPYPYSPHYLMAPFWERLKAPTTGGPQKASIFVKQLGQQLVIQWDRWIRNYYNAHLDSVVTFEIIINAADSSVTFQYDENEFHMGDFPSNTLSIGIQGDGNDDNGTNYCYRTTPYPQRRPEGGRAVKFALSQSSLAPWTPVTFEWTLVGEATMGILSDSLIAGVIPGASEGFDPAFDVPKPPAPPSGYLQVYFDHPEYSDPVAQRLHLDARAPFGDSVLTRMWPAALASDLVDSTVLLTFGVDSVPGEYGVRFQMGEQFIDLRTTPQFPLMIDSSFIDGETAWLWVTRDLQAPVVNVTAPVGHGLYQVGDTVTVSWDVTDASPIFATRLYFSPDSGASFWLLNSFSGNPGSAQVILADSMVSSLALFKVEAIDQVGNVGSDETDQLFGVVPESLERSYPAGWNMVNVPYEVASYNTGDVFQEIDGPYFVYGWTQNGYVQASLLQRDRGYWLGLLNPDTVTYAGSVAGDTIVTPLFVGWTMVGSHLPVDLPAAMWRVRRGSQTVSWSQALANGWIASEFIFFDPLSGSYQSADYAPLATGCWVAALVDSVELLRSQYFTASKQEIRELQRQVSPPQLLSITAASGQWSDQLAELGVDSLASDGFETSFDLPKPVPPPGNGYVYTAFVHPEWPVAGIVGENFARDIRSAAFDSTGIKEWLLRVKAPVNQAVTLSWQGVQNFPLADWELKLIRSSTGEEVNMQSQSSFVYAPTSDTEEFVVRVGYRAVGVEPPAALPTRYALHQNYPNPFNPSTTIRYQLPQPSQVSLQVYNLLGQRVRTLVEKRQAPGYYQVVWDGRNDSGVQVSSGIYLLRMTARPLSGHGQQFEATRKLMFLK